MSLAGALFLGIVVLWLLYLVPVWLHDRALRRAEVRAERRVTRRVVLTPGRPVVSEPSPVRLTPQAEARLRARASQARAAARGRSIGALAGAVALVATASGALAGGWSWWGAVLSASWLSLVVFGGATSAARRRRRRAARLRHARVATAVLPTAHPDRPVYDDEANRRVATPAEHGVTGTVPAGSTGATGSETTTAGKGAAVGPGREGETWTPVEIPAPVYATKPVAMRPPATPWSVPPAARAALEAALGAATAASETGAGGAGSGEQVAGGGVAGGEGADGAGARSA